MARPSRSRPRKSTTDAEAAQKELDGLNAQLAKVQQDRDAQAGVLSTQGAELDSQINSLVSERKQYSGDVEPRTLAQYDRVRGARGGLGFVPAVGGRCKGCNMMVPPQMFNEIRKLLQIYSCPSCHRLLFVPGEGGPESQAPDPAAGG